MRKQLEILGLEFVLGAITDYLDATTDKMRFIPTGPNAVARKRVAEFRRMLSLAGSDESDEDRDYHLSRAVEIGQQIGYMSNPSPTDVVELHCYGWKLHVRGSGGSDETETQ